MNKTPRVKDAGFTLLEMLIVIVAIAILMSLLLPVLSQARGQSLKMACANNLKQIGVACSSYEIDNDGYPVVAYQPGEYYYQLLDDYLGFPGGWKLANDKTMNVFRCPVASDKNPWSKEQWQYTSFSGNHDIHPFIAPWATTPVMGRVFNMRDPSHSYSLTDGYEGWAGNILEPKKFADFRHGVSINILFMDSRVGSENFSASPFLDIATGGGDPPSTNNLWY